MDCKTVPFAGILIGLSLLTGCGDGSAQSGPVTQLSSGATPPALTAEARAATTGTGVTASGNNGAGNTLATLGTNIGNILVQLGQQDSATFNSASSCAVYQDGSYQTVVVSGAGNTITQDADSSVVVPDPGGYPLPADKATVNGKGNTVTQNVAYYTWEGKTAWVPCTCTLAADVSSSTVSQVGAQASLKTASNCKLTQDKLSVATLGGTSNVLSQGQFCTATLSGERNNVTQTGGGSCTIDSTVTDSTVSTDQPNPSLSSQNATSVTLTKGADFNVTIVQPDLSAPNVPLSFVSVDGSGVGNDTVDLHSPYGSLTVTGHDDSLTVDDPSGSLYPVQMTGDHMTASYASGKWTSHDQYGRPLVITVHTNLPRHITITVAPGT